MEGQGNDSKQQILNIDYINIQDKEILKGIIENHKIGIQQSLEEIKELSTICDRNEAENAMVLNNMKDLQQKNHDKILSYRQQIEKFSVYQQRAFDEFSQERQKTLKALQHKKNIELDKEQQLLDHLHSQYNLTLTKSEQEQKRYIEEIRQKHALLITEQYEHHDNMNRQESQEQLQNADLLHTNLELIKQIKSNVRQYAGNIVYEEKEYNQNRNYQLKAKLLQLRDQLDKLKKERNNIVKTRNECKINQSLNEEEVEEYKAVGSLQKAKIKSHKDKVERLKKVIASEIGKMEQKIKEKKKHRENELRGTKIKLFNLQKGKEQMKMSVEKYKVLADTILLQREQVEEFFLMAIESCKKDMEMYKGSEDANERHYGQKVDIDELLPKDKHRIVTNLYTKLALAPK